ncbi:class I adenylate-forming enzyme family protein [Falsiroseomonas sp. HW251]|uniref:class I adenylate-forming enzyme family protein n=1 Tax=Falsiroseomonas sp. HW251 TaxID=3390998 RepID=UPI003D31E138
MTEPRGGLVQLARGWLGRDEPALAADRTQFGWAELLARAAEAEAELAPFVQAGDAVGLCAASGVGFVVLLLALNALQASVFPVHDGATDAELARIAAHEGARAVLHDRERPGLPWRDGATLSVAGQPIALRLVGPHAAAPGGPGLHLYTSGTEGKLKGVVRAEAALLAEARSIVGMLGLRPGVRVLAAVPLSHAYGLGMGLLGPLAGGATMVIEQPQTPRAFARCLEAHRPDIVIGVPALYDLWSRGTGVAPAGVARLCISSGAPLPPSIAAAFTRAWGRPVARQYGMSECGPVAIDLEDRPEPGCAGRAYPGVAIAVEAEEIVVRTPSAASGLVGGALEPPGSRVLRTGDRGWIDGEGRLFLAARRALQINVHGRKLDPAEVEEAIRAGVAVRDVAVIGIPTPAGDDRVAALVAGDGVSVEDVEEACRARLAAWKLPRQVVIAAAVPRTAAGKPDRPRILAALGSI